ncbi:sensor histidine kinase [Altericroceibacterium endophyticum]|uniref:histidine kinase n=1 Tax=Altericroceibacterium endophyticum TaxID=1808508 RepID=A0A6I4T8D2_9SPHN|nr:HAMP domain-containing sensor histidine kinase [Altericroceibacterium endophyticum]MXO66759.1 sensor histidine kinase [Altericroceibacterium endophyticum]
MIHRAQSSIFSRIVVLSIGLALLLVAALWLLTDRTIRNTLDENARQAVDLDLAGLVDIYASGGGEELQRRIADRLALTPTDGTVPHYLLLGPGGQRLAGDLDHWPALDPAVSESGRIVIGRATPAFARSTLLAPDKRLLVAHEADDALPLLQRVALSFAAGGLLFALVVGLFARVTTRRLQCRIGVINAAFQTGDSGFMDACEQKAAPDEIDELASHSAAALARVQRLMEAYRDSSDQVAHEIRTPLTHLDNKLVKALAADPEAGIAQELQAARGEIRSLVHTLESLLDIASSNARRGDPHSLRPVNLSRLSSRICELYSDSAEESGHEFSWDIRPGVVIDGEEDQLARLITNLLDNAFKYVPSGGRIDMSLEPGPVLVVEDDGPGIPAGDRERIFDRFYRSADAARDSHGAGLGLSLAKAIAERHGLALSLEMKDRGTRFVVRGEMAG